MGAYAYRTAVTLSIEHAQENVCCQAYLQLLLSLAIIDGPRSFVLIDPGARFLQPKFVSCFLAGKFSDREPMLHNRSPFWVAKYLSGNFELVSSFALDLDVYNDVKSFVVNGIHDRALKVTLESMAYAHLSRILSLKRTWF